MPPDVFVLIGDCLRAASATERTLPFCRAAADLRFERCYAPGTWTLPSHASLYTGSPAVDHGVTRWGDRIDRGQAWLPETARRNGYATALVSENPTFSGRYGFDRGVDLADDFVNAKPFPSDFAAETVVEERSPGAVASVLAGIAESDRPLRSVANALFAPLAYGRDWLASPASRWPGTRFPHRGDRVRSHLRSIVADPPGADGAPLLATANVLEPHNPHSVPPRRGARALGLDVPGAEQSRLASVDDNKIFLFESPDEPPAGAAEYGSWEAVFSRREEIYEAQIREFDRVVADLAGDLGERFDEALVVVTGDHGQLFGEEGMVGHHTSLHPHAVHVPLLVSLPADWAPPDGPVGVDGPAGVAEDAEVAEDTEVIGESGSTGHGGVAGARSLDEPVSLVGLSRAIGAVVSGEIRDAEAFADRVRAGGERPVVVTVDGPNWSVPDLEDRYGADAVADLAVRKVGLFGRDTQVVLASPWDDDSIAVTEYALEDGGRRRVAGYEFDEWRANSGVATRFRAALGRDRLAAFERWLAPEHATPEAGPATNRLRRLGYR